MRSRILQITLLLLSPLIHAAIHNVTIDDTHGDPNTGAKPTYLPEGRWQHPDCAACAIKPPLQQVFMKTYSAITYDPTLFPSISIRFSFHGIAIFVYFIVANFVSDGTTTETFCNFTLDGDLMTPYHHFPTSSTNYEFNHLVFSKENLSNKSHTLIISTSGINKNLFTSFDYAVYQVDDGIESKTSQPSPTHTPNQAPPQVTVTRSTSTKIVSSTSVFTSTTGSALAPSEIPQPTPSSSGSVSSLPNSSHGITITWNASGTLETTVIRDTETGLASLSSPSSTRAPQSSSSSSVSSVTADNAAHKTPDGVIAGSVVGGVAFIIILLLLVFFLCRRRRRATHTDSPSTNPEPKPRYPVLIPFTSFSPRHRDVEARVVEGRSPFTSIRKQRNVRRGPGSQGQRSPSASVHSDSDLLEAQRQSMIARQINSLKKELDALGSSASIPSRSGGSDTPELVQQNRTMKAEIERLQWQLKEPPPEYSRSVDNTHHMTSSPAPVAVS